jgi:hypothetical protein
MCPAYFYRIMLGELLDYYWLFIRGIYAHPDKLKPPGNNNSPPADPPYVLWYLQVVRPSHRVYIRLY